MMQMMDMPCCGAKPHTDKGEFNDKACWDAVTGLCRTCGEHRSLYTCGNSECRGITERDVRFCNSCHAAYELGRKEQKESFQGTEPDWGRACSVCEATPVVPVTGLCGPCTFGEAETANGNW